jgi:cell division protein ZapA
MAQLTVRVNGRDYPIACADGEEEHVGQLARYLDARVREVVQQVGQLGEMQVLLMTALNIADDLAEAVTRLEEQPPPAAQAAPAAGESAEDAAAVAALAERVERIAAALEKT